MLERLNVIDCPFRVHRNFAKKKVQILGFFDICGYHEIRINTIISGSDTQRRFKLKCWMISDPLPLFLFVYELKFGSKILFLL